MLEKVGIKNVTIFSIDFRFCEEEIPGIIAAVNDAVEAKYGNDRGIVYAEISKGTENERTSN